MVSDDSTSRVIAKGLLKPGLDDRGCSLTLASEGLHEDLHVDRKITD